MPDYSARVISFLLYVDMGTTIQPVKYCIVLWLDILKIALIADRSYIRSFVGVGVVDSYCKKRKLPWMRR